MVFPTAKENKTFAGNTKLMRHCPADPGAGSPAWEVRSSAERESTAETGG